jgi:hypothetical protein
VVSAGILIKFISKVNGPFEFFTTEPAVFDPELRPKGAHREKILNLFLDHFSFIEINL